MAEPAIEVPSLGEPQDQRTGFAEKTRALSVPGAELNLHENNDLAAWEDSSSAEAVGMMPVWAGRLSHNRMIHLGSPRNVPAEKVRQGLSRVRFLVLRDLLRRALGYDAAAILAALGT